MPNGEKKVRHVESRHVRWPPQMTRRARISVNCALVLYFFACSLWVYRAAPDRDPSLPTPETTNDTYQQLLLKDWDKRPCQSDIDGLWGSGKTQSPWTRPRGPTSHWVDVLGRLISLIPKEHQAEELLRPIECIECTVEAQLQELAIRTRYFRRMFNAWENVHSGPRDDPPSFYKHGDVRHYLPEQPDIAAGLGMSPNELVSSLDAFKSVMDRLSGVLFPWRMPWPIDLMEFHAMHYHGGKGIVFLTGDLHAPMLLTSIPIIRKLGCDLPIEVFFYGNLDLSPAVREKIEALPGVTARNLNFLLDSGDWQLDLWAGKPFTMLLSSFREVMFIDADSLFFQNPEKLFEDAAYLETGALFFKDRLIAPESKRSFLWRILPKPISDKAQESRFWTAESGHMQESGVVVVDKWRHFVTLMLVARLNGPDRHGDPDKGTMGVYDMVFGDKETFWLGWEMSGNTEYAFHNGGTGTMGLAREVNNVGLKGNILIAADPPRYRICAPQLLHLDRNGRPLWFNGWILPTKWDKDKQPAKFEEFLREPTDHEGSPWELHEHNVCCLTSEDKMDFSLKETKILDQIIATGRAVGALAE
ncbi:mannosyltransferase putative-domain-containing protein [Aspergillus filifer]